MSQDVLCEEATHTHRFSGIVLNISVLSFLIKLLLNHIFTQKIPPDESDSKPRKTTQLFCKKEEKLC